MKKFIYLLAIFLTILQACNEDMEQGNDKEVPTCEQCDFNCLDSNDTDIITNNCLDNWTCSFQISPQSKVDIEEYEGKTIGNKNVFQMINSTEGSPMIADDELTNILVLELEESQNSFTVEGAEMENMDVHFRRICYCIDSEFKAVTTGCIQGEKQTDGTWFIKLISDPIGIHLAAI